MSSTFEKSVKGATKVKLAPPKSKYVEHILLATHSGENGVAEVFRSLQFRLRDSTWTIAFKALIVVHLMIRDGEPNVTLKYLSQQSPQKVLAVNTYTDVQTQGRNIRNYSRYLVERARAYAKTRWDYVASAAGRLKRLPVDKGLLRETESVQDQIQACLRCGDFFTDEPENEISLTAFRAITMDLLALFAALNEGTIAILEHYFEMSKPDAERALEIYKKFASQTDKVVRFLSLARNYEHVTRLEIPNIKHAPTNLINSLEEYLHDNDFEINRRQYLAQQEASKNKSGGSNKSPFATNSVSKGQRALIPGEQSSQASFVAQPTKGAAPDLIDFFGSIDQQPMISNPAPSQQQSSFNPFQQQPVSTAPSVNQGFPAQQAFQPQQQVAFVSQHYSVQQQTQPQQTGFGVFDQPNHQAQSNFTGAGFGNYGSQPQQPQFTTLPQQQQQGSQRSFSSDIRQPLPPQPNQLQTQPTGSNPFRQSMLPSAPAPQVTGFASGQGFTTSQTGRNPFAQSAVSGAVASTPNHAQQLTPQRTGTNPFARTSPQSNLAVPPLPLQPNLTGSTNPFRQSQFINQQTGQGWQDSQGTMGGMEQLVTTSVFPRPGQPQQQQQEPQQYQQQHHQQNPWA